MSASTVCVWLTNKRARRKCCCCSSTGDLVLVAGTRSPFDALLLAFLPMASASLTPVSASALSCALVPSTLCTPHISLWSSVTPSPDSFAHPTL